MSEILKQFTKVQRKKTVISLHLNSFPKHLKANFISPFHSILKFVVHKNRITLRSIWTTYVGLKVVLYENRITQSIFGIFRFIRCLLLITCLRVRITLACSNTWLQPVGSLVKSAEGLVPPSCGRVESPCNLLYLFSPGLLPPDCPEGRFHVVYRPQSQGASLPLTLHVPLSKLSNPLYLLATGPLPVSNKRANQPGGEE